MDGGPVTADAPAEVVHAEACEGTCGTWIAAGTPGCLPYPCRCVQTREEAPDWARRQGQAKCWWQKKGQEDTPGGGFRSRCPCWGGSRDGKPGDCCSHHSANPFYGMRLTFGTADPDAEPMTMRGVMAAIDEFDPVDADTPPAEDGEPDESAFDWPEEIRQPFIRRWEPADLTCQCVLPYAADKRVATVHCVSCCTDWANPQTFAVHRRRWTEPCRDPWKIRDCVTGRPLLYQDGEGIWRDSYPGADDGVPAATAA